MRFLAVELFSDVLTHESLEPRVIPEGMPRSFGRVTYSSRCETNKDTINSNIYCPFNRFFSGLAK
jgi:hypothetical protein